jgi:hypothetical protein
MVFKFVATSEGVTFLGHFLLDSGQAPEINIASEDPSINDGVI